MEKEILEHGLNINRRKFLSRLSLGIGSVALGSLLIPDLFERQRRRNGDDGSSAFCAKGKTDYLSVSEWRSFTT